MTYTVLARRYRSRDFDEVVGQEPIARTLRNAIDQHRTAHAYLFCGTRGVGKTSMARIFARALNVTPDLAQADAIGDAILRGEDLDVIEIDGASNRGIQEVRDLIANAGLSPARCPWKIYIIDEVHMLTREAFNALLKTMEEPPPHVKFILCTTEPQKVPATIQSRCQRFDFRPLPTARIAAHLREILAAEGLEAEDEVIHQVARLGRGSMRDALSLLDRLLAAGEKVLTGSLLEQMLGVPDHALVEAVIDAVIESDAAGVLHGGDRLLAGGASVEQALELLTDALRNLLVAVACGADLELLDLPEEAAARVARQAEHFDAPGLVHMIALCDAVARRAGGSAVDRALFDAALVRLATSQRIADIASLLEGGAAAAPGKKKDRTPTRAEPLSRPASLAEPKPRAEAPAPASVPAPASRFAPAPPADDEDDLDVADLWTAVMRAAEGSASRLAKLEQLAPRRLDGTTLVLELTDAGAGMARSLQRQASSLAAFIAEATGRRLRLEIVEGAAPPSSPAPSAPGASAQDLAATRDLPLVAEAAELFDATITDVRDEPSDGRE